MPKIADNSWRKMPSQCQECGANMYPTDLITKSAWSKRMYCSKACRAKNPTVRQMPSLDSRFWDKVNKEPGQGPWGDCWTWTARREHGGHGRISLPGGRKHVSAHRYSYQMAHGDPGDMFVCHKCDVAFCVNPDHLFLGTPLDNMRDKMAKGRQTCGEKSHLSKLTEAQVLEIRKDNRKLKEISLDYGITMTGVSYIKNRKSWRHLE